VHEALAEPDTVAGMRAPPQVWPRENLRRYEVEVVALWDNKVQAVAFQNQSRRDRFSRNGRLGNYSPREFALAHRFDLGILVGKLQDHRRNPLRPVGRTFLRLREPSLLLDVALVTMPSLVNIVASSAQLVRRMRRGSVRSRKT
jgi:hypothetical protein